MYHIRTSIRILTNNAHLTRLTLFMHKLNFGSMKCYGWVSSILMKTHSKCLSHQKAIKLVKRKDTIVFLQHCMSQNTLV